MFNFGMQTTEGTFTVNVILFNIGSSGLHMHENCIFLLLIHTGVVSAGGNELLMQ